MADRHPSGRYRGKVCAVFSVVRSLQLLCTSGCRQEHPSEIETRLPSGRPAILRFNVGERGMLFAVFVPRAHLVQGCDG